MKKVCEIFMENDKKGLEELYKITNDKLCKILIEWYDEFEEITACEETNEYYMYDDIIGYLWEKYDIGGNRKESGEII